MYNIQGQGLNQAVVLKIISFTHSLTHSLHEAGALLDKIISYSVMKISAFYGIQGFIRGCKLGQTWVYAVYLIPEGFFYEAV
jgi:hypothetical protein